jgi:hypothetical protein
VADRLSRDGHPAGELERAVDGSHPDLAVLAATRAETLEPSPAGAGATAQTASAAGARLMAGDPVTEAGRAGWSR